MSFKQPIKIAGIGLSWTEAYAETYRCRLEEMGFSSKKMCVGDNKYLVGYCHRSFTVKDMESSLQELNN